MVFGFLVATGVQPYMNIQIRKPPTEVGIMLFCKNFCGSCPILLAMVLQLDDVIKTRRLGLDYQLRELEISWIRWVFDASSVGFSLKGPYKWALPAGARSLCNMKESFTHLLIYFTFCFLTVSAILQRNNHGSLSEHPQQIHQKIKENSQNQQCLMFWVVKGHLVPTS